MKTHFLSAGLLLAATIAVSSAVSYNITAQAPARTDQSAASATTRLPDGRPDLIRLGDAFAIAAESPCIGGEIGVLKAGRHDAAGQVRSSPPPRELPARLARLRYRQPHFADCPHVTDAHV